MIATVIADHLVSAGIGLGVPQSGSDWLVLVNGVTDLVDAPQIAIIDRAGFPPLTSHGNTSPLRAGVQVLIRGSPNGYADAFSKMTDVWDALHRSRFGTIQSLEAVNNPLWIGYTDDRQPTWSINLIAWTT